MWYSQQKTDKDERQKFDRRFTENGWIEATTHIYGAKWKQLDTPLYRLSLYCTVRVSRPLSLFQWIRPTTAYLE